MARENISREMALERLKKDDHQRREWSRSLYGVDTWDPSLYDLVVHIHKLRVDDAVDIICHTAGLKQFKTTAESQQALDDLVLAARVKGALVETYPTVKVSVHGGVAMIHVKASGMQEAQIIDDIHALTEKITGVREVKVHLVPTTLLE